MLRTSATKNVTHGGTRTPNLRFRRPTPYPLGHAGTLQGNVKRIKLLSYNIGTPKFASVPLSLEQLWNGSRGRVVKASDSKSDSLWERRFESYRLRYRVLLWHSAMVTIPLDKNYPTWSRLCLQWLGGLGVWFALRVREVPGSIPGRARPFLEESRLEVRVLKEVKIFFIIRKECKTNMERWGIEPQAFRMRSGRSTTELLPQFSKSFVRQQCISY